MPYIRTAFFTAALAYLALLFLDYREPGFVSDVFSAHVIGGLALAFGVLWGWRAPREQRRSLALPLVIGLAAAVMVWDLGAVFGDFRILLALVVLALPWLTVRLLDS